MVNQNHEVETRIVGGTARVLAAGHDPYCSVFSVVFSWLWVRAVCAYLIFERAQEQKVALARQWRSGHER